MYEYESIFPKREPTNWKNFNVNKTVEKNVLTRLNEMLKMQSKASRVTLFWPWIVNFVPFVAQNMKIKRRISEIKFLQNETMAAKQKCTFFEWEIMKWCSRTANQGFCFALYTLNRWDWIISNMNVNSWHRQT